MSVIHQCAQQSTKAESETQNVFKKQRHNLH